VWKIGQFDGRLHTPRALCRIYAMAGVFLGAMEGGQWNRQKLLAPRKDTPDMRPFHANSLSARIHSVIVIFGMALAILVQSVKGQDGRLPNVTLASPAAGSWYLPAPHPSYAGLQWPVENRGLPSGQAHAAVYPRTAQPYGLMPRPVQYDYRMLSAQPGAMHYAAPTNVPYPQAVGPATRYSAAGVTPPIVAHYPPMPPTASPPLQSVSPGPAWRALPISATFAQVPQANAFVSPQPGQYAPRFWSVDYRNLQEPASGAAEQPANTTENSASNEEGDLFGPVSDADEIGGPFISTRSFAFWNDDLGIDGAAEFPVISRMNVCEHNSPLPRDRAFLVYKNYSNVLNNELSSSSAPFFQQDSRSIDQYIFGYEKTFQDKRSSLELRMPFFSTGSSQFNGGFSSNDPRIGNFALIGKRILYSSEEGVLSAGCAITMPTGDDTVFSVGSQTFSFQNNSANVIPFLGIYKTTFSQRSYLITFMALDIPTRGNQVQFVDPVDGAQDLGRLTDQSLLYLDFSLGHWLYRNPHRPILTGLAVQTEFHYAGTLGDANSLSGVRSGVGWNTGYEFGNSRNRFNNTFGAFGNHAELQNQTDIRVMGLFPLGNASNRFFDSEIIVSAGRRF